MDKLTGILIEDSGNVEIIRQLTVDTFRQTFAGSNTEEDMHAYIENECSIACLAAQIDDPDSLFSVAWVDGMPAGYLKVNVGGAQTEARGNGTLEIQRIYVLEQYKGHGIGGMLMERALDTARRLGKRSVWLGVWEHNRKALDFYQHKGFGKVGEHVFMLGSDRQVDYLMELDLPATD